MLINLKNKSLKEYTQEIISQVRTKYIQLFSNYSHESSVASLKNVVHFWSEVITI